jgi:hypothetical protein
MLDNGELLKKFQEKYGTTNLEIVTAVSEKINSILPNLLRIRQLYIAELLQRVQW